MQIKNNTIDKNIFSLLNFLIIALVVLIVVQWRTGLSLLEQWWGSFTYGHGLFIVPLSIYLIWRKWDQLSVLTLNPSIKGLVVFIVLNVCWWIGYILDIGIIQQVSLLAMFPIIFWTMVGWKATSVFLFPLLLPVIALPIWSPLETILQHTTTQAVTVGLFVIGVPIFVEGHFINIPAGKFSIEETCAGLRYLLAAVTISLVYTHLYLKKRKFKIAFLVFTVILSLAVNWIRVFSVVLAGHLTNMTHSFVRDHADFGWWLFAITLIPIFLLGNYLANKENKSDRRGEKLNSQNNNSVSAEQKQASYVIPTIVFIIIVGIPLSGFILKEQSKVKLKVSGENLQAPSSLSSWMGPSNASPDNLHPQFDTADAKLMVSYSKEEKHALLFLAKYGYQEQGQELIGLNNRLYDETFWSEVSSSVRKFHLNEKESIEINETIIRNPLGKMRILWHWYSVAGINTVKPIIAKALILKDVFSKEKIGSSVVLIAADVEQDIEQAQEVLIDFAIELRSVANAKLNGFT